MPQKLKHASSYVYLKCLCNCPNFVGFQLEIIGIIKNSKISFNDC